MSLPIRFAPAAGSGPKSPSHPFRHVYLDIDDDGDARLAALRASDAVPPAFAILSTSPGKYQVFWRVEGFDFEQQEITLKRLAIAFGGDPACTDCNRVLRIPGFLNRKYSPAHSVAVEYPSDAIAHPADFRLPEDMAVVALRFAGSHGKAAHGRTPTQRQIGHGYVMSLPRGKTPAS